jgi:hypothetical protein
MFQKNVNFDDWSKRNTLKPGDQVYITLEKNILNGTKYKCRRYGVVKSINEWGYISVDWELKNSINKNR